MKSRMLVFVLCLCCACGGGGGGGSDGSADVTFGRAACESGVSLKDINPQGYDLLYNFDSQRNPPASFVLDAASTDSECAKILSTREVFPWVRIDQQTSDDPSKLAFELLKPGGRNSEVLLSTPINNSNAQSVNGGFFYKVQYELFEGESVQSTLDCDVQFDGSYCPFLVPNAQNASSPDSAFHFSADGTVQCRVTHSNGAPETSCGGRLVANDTTLDLGYYGE